MRRKSLKRLATLGFVAELAVFAEEFNKAVKDYDEQQRQSIIDEQDSTPSDRQDTTIAERSSSS